jgi:uncharacterized FlaG/YvyC family protein
MRIDGASPIPSAVPQSVARQAKVNPAPEAKVPVGKDHLEMQPKPEINSTNVLVEMKPGNIVVYKFIDQASGRLVQQIPSEQMLNLSESTEAAKGKKRT